MAAAPERQTPSVGEVIRQEPRRFQLFRLAYLLRRLEPPRAVRFVAETQLGYPVTAVTELRRVADANEIVTTRGAAGYAGALPGDLRRRLAVAADDGGPLSEMAQGVTDRLLQNGFARWQAARPYLREEGEFVRELLMLANAGQAEEEPTTEALASLAGWLLQRSTPALEAACTDYFGVPVQVQSSGNGCRLRVGPLRFAEYEDFLPGGTALRPLLRLAGMFLRPGWRIEVLLVLRGDEVPLCRPGHSQGATLRWACWPRDPRQPLREDPHTLLSAAECRAALGVATRQHEEE